MNDSGAIVRAVAAGAGLACVSALAASQASTNAKVQYVQLEELQLTRPLWRVQRTTPVVSPLLTGFINALEQVIEESE
ncbi:hypothetical protein GCM10028792_29480 [Salinisphaera aquimarina]